MSVESIQCPFCASQSFSFVLKEIEMFLCHHCQRYMPNETAKSFRKKNNTSVQKSSTIVDYSSLLTRAQKINTLPQRHEAVELLQKRKVPSEFLNDLYYVENFRQFLQGTEYEKKVDSFAKIIIPLRSQNGLFGIQARKIDVKDKGPKYFTVKFVECASIFGRERVDRKKPIYVVEGPFDSMFLQNSIAVTGSGISKIDFEGDFVYCLDNEPRNKSIVNIMKQLLSKGNKVVIWPEKIREKDINEMSLSGIDVNTVVKSNIYSGAKGIIKLSNWKKV